MLLRKRLRLRLHGFKEADYVIDTHTAVAATSLPEIPEGDR